MTLTKPPPNFVLASHLGLDLHEGHPVPVIRNRFSAAVEVQETYGAVGSEAFCDEVLQLFKARSQHVDRRRSASLQVYP